MNDAPSPLNLKQEYAHKENISMGNFIKKEIKKQKLSAELDAQTVEFDVIWRN